MTWRDVAFVRLSLFAMRYLPGWCDALFIGLVARLLYRRQP